jgi:purine-nucleoside phosphorylase
MRPRFSDVFEIGGPNECQEGILEDVLIGTYRDVCVGYASVIGAPMASELTHLFGVLGARLVIQIGTCGGFGEGLEAGDLFAAEEAYCGEGASQYYKTDGKTVAATVMFTETSDSRFDGVPIKRGRIYTTSALFAESRADIDRWAAQGFSAVDMETSATFAVAEHFGMDRGSLLTVYDNPRGDDHLLASDAERDKHWAKAQEAMVEIALDTIVSRAKEIQRKRS